MDFDGNQKTGLNLLTVPEKMANEIRKVWNDGENDVTVTVKAAVGMEEIVAVRSGRRYSRANCVAAWGPWPSGTLTLTEGDWQVGPDPRYNQPFVSCFSVVTKPADGSAYSQCWSESVRIDSGLDSEYQTCEPRGVRSAAWSVRGSWEYGTPQIDTDGTATCGPPCTTFVKRLSYF